MMRSISRMLMWLSLALAAGCGGGGGGGGGSAPPPPPPPPPPATAYVDSTQASNLSYVVGYTSVPGWEEDVALSSFGGAAAGDCDNDGDIDLFITYGDTDGNGPGGPNRLYLNQLVELGNGLLFVDEAVAAGVANTRADGRGNDRHSGPTFADMDGDGDLDLFVGGLYGDSSKIYENIGVDQCVFEDVTDNSPDLVNMTVDPVDPDLPRWVHTLSAGFGDYDLDGDLDMYLTHWGTLDTIYTGTNPSPMETHHLWRNDFVESGVLRFLNVSEASDISDHVWLTRAYPGSSQYVDYSFTPTFARLDGDLWPDIAIAGDFQTSQVYLNNGDRATFSNLDNVSLQNAQYGMGSALGDVDNDGDLDWFVTSIFASAAEGADSPLNGNRFYTNLLDAGDPNLFADETVQAGVDAGGWGWGACFLDIDNDSDLDIYHTNGWPEKGFQGISIWDDDRSRVFVRNGGGTFDEAGASLGLDDSLSGRGVVCADFDHDGDVDILQLTDAASNSARLWENRSAAAGNNYLRIELEGLSPNTQAAGARIFVSIDAVGPEQMREIMIGSNHTAQNPTVQIFGLAAATRVNQIRVEWPALYDSGSGIAVQPPPTIIDEATDSRLDATVQGDTLMIRHPDLP